MNEILIDAALTKQLAGLWESEMQKPPTEAELASLIDHWVREETFFQEALNLGLDQADTIVRRRLIQKYQFLLEEVDDEALNEAAVAAYYQQNQDRYRHPQRIHYDHILLSQTYTEAAARSDLAAGKDWRKLGTDSLLARSYKGQSQQDILHTLGPTFQSRLDLGQQGRWQGPIRSSYGQHLVRITQIEAPALKPLETIANKVRFDLAAAIGERSKAQAFEALRPNYPVVDRRAKAGQQ